MRNAFVVAALVTAVLLISYMSAASETYAVTGLTVDAEKSNKRLAIHWNAEAGAVFYVVQVIEEKCRAGQTVGCGEFERLYKTVTTSTAHGSGDKLYVNAEYGAYYTVQVNAITYQNGAHTVGEISQVTGKTIGVEDPLPDRKPNVFGVKVNAVNYSNNSFDAAMYLSAGVNSGGHTLVREWSAVDQNGKKVELGRIERTQSALQMYPDNHISGEHRRDNHYTISFRAHNGGEWTDPFIITIDWEPHKRDVIKQVKQKIEETKNAGKTHSQKIWQRVLLAIDPSVPADSEYRHDPVLRWGTGNGAELTPFGISNPDPNKGALAIGNKHVAAANKLLEEGKTAAYEKRTAVAELWFNIDAHWGD